MLFYSLIGTVMFKIYLLEIFCDPLVGRDPSVEKRCSILNTMTDVNYKLYFRAEQDLPPNNSICSFLYFTGL
jgi:hypothetical protein